MRKSEILKMIEELDDMLFELALLNDDKTTTEQWHALSRANTTIKHLEKYPL